MYEKELQKLRRKILRAVSASSRQLLDTKVKNNRPIAVYNIDHVEVIDAKDFMSVRRLR